MAEAEGGIGPSHWTNAAFVAPYMLILLGIYTFMVGNGVHIHWIIASFGLFISLAMSFVWRRHRYDQVL